MSPLSYGDTEVIHVCHDSWRDDSKRKFTRIVYFLPYMSRGERTLIVYAVYTSRQQSIIDITTNSIGVRPGKGFLVGRHQISVEWPQCLRECNWFAPGWKNRNIYGRVYTDGALCQKKRSSPKIVQQRDQSHQHLRRLPSSDEAPALSTPPPPPNH